MPKNCGLCGGELEEHETYCSECGTDYEETDELEDDLI